MLITVSLQVSITTSYRDTYLQELPLQGLKGLLLDTPARQAEKNSGSQNGHHWRLPTH